MEPLSTNYTFQKTIQIIAIVLLSVTALATRLHAPWQMELITDETIHLSTYFPDNEKQKFLDRLNQALLAHPNFVGPENILKFDDIYNHSYFLQRLQFVFIRDAHPPLFNLLAELINCLPSHKLIVLRICSMTASLIFILFLYLAGREYGGHALGLWLAGLATVDLEFRIYSGIGRPYAFAQMMMACVLFAFLRRKHTPSANLRLFLLVALFAQATDWALWGFIAPLLLAAGYDFYRTTGSIKRILRESWWYALISIALLSIIRLQTSNPTISRQLEASRKWIDVWHSFSLVAPFAELGNFFVPLASIGAALFLVLCMIGGIRIAKNPERQPLERYSLALAMIVSGLEILAAPSGSRFVLIPVTILLFSAGVGINVLLFSRKYSELTFTVMMAIFLAIFLVKPESPYERIFNSETPYSLVAQRLAAEMKPGDVWFSEPYYLANNLYLDGAPTPLTPIRDDYDAAILHRCASEINCYVFSYATSMQYDSNFRDVFTLPSAKPYWFQNGMVLFLYPHKK